MDVLFQQGTKYGDSMKTTCSHIDLCPDNKLWDQFESTISKEDVDVLKHISTLRFQMASIWANYYNSKT